MKNKITFLDVDIYKGPNFSTTNTFNVNVETHIKPTNLLSLDCYIRTNLSSFLLLDYTAITNSLY